MLQLTTIFFLISFSLLAVLHYLSIKLFLYWRLWWLDIPIHFFGGAVVALGVYTLRDLRIIQNKWLTLPMVLLIVVGVALVWEVFELYAGVTVIDSSYYLDTAIDLCMGLAGGVIGHFVGRALRSL